MTPPCPHLTITTGAASSSDQPLSENLVSLLSTQYPEQSLDQVNRMVTAWQQDDGVTLYQITTTMTTNEVVVLKRTPTPTPFKAPTLLPSYTAEQIPASFTALSHPVVQTAIVLPAELRRQLHNQINWGMSATDEAVYQCTTITAINPTPPGHFQPSTPPSKSSSEISDIHITVMSKIEEPIPVPPSTIKHDMRPSLFTTPKSKVQIPASDPPMFPQSRFCEWMKTPLTCDKLLGELVKNNLLITNQFTTFSSVHKHAEETQEICKTANMIKTEFKEFQKIGQCIENHLDSLFTKIAKMEDMQTNHSHSLMTTLPSSQLMKDAPGFFQCHDDWTAPVRGTPLCYAVHPLPHLHLCTCQQTNTYEQTNTHRHISTCSCTCHCHCMNAYYHLCRNAHHCMRTHKRSHTRLLSTYP